VKLWKVLFPVPYKLLEVFKIARFEEGKVDVLVVFLEVLWRETCDVFTKVFEAKE